MLHGVRLLIVIVVLLSATGCGRSKGPERKIVTPVKGIILVDAQIPATPVSIACQPIAGIDIENPTYSQCVSNEDGTFQLSTYETGDGVPAGEYALTFTWGQFNKIAMTYSGDKFKGKYDGVTKSPTRFTVIDGEPLDLGVINLSTGR